MKKNNRIWIYLLTVMGFVLILTNCCKKDNKEDNSTAPVLKVPVLTTSSVSNITAFTASCGGNITSDGGSTITARGVCWSTWQNPTILNSKTTDSAGIGSFTSSIINLSTHTSYYVRAYATNSVGTSYGNNVLFKTLCDCPTTITDIDGNTYNTVIIGDQCWMAENLKVTKYRNGAPIPKATGSAWDNCTTGAYCDYNNDVNNSITYGKLYNWYAVFDNQNIAPTGWHVANSTDWTALINYLGGFSVAGFKMKETGFTHWQSPNTGATNESGFTALPAGVCYTSTFFYGIGFLTYWWSADAGNAVSLFIGATGILSSNSSTKTCGMSVRCVKD